MGGRPIGKRRLLVIFTALLLAQPALNGCAPTVKRAEEWLTPSVKSEKEMGREFAQEAAKKLSLVEDPDILEYVAHIGAPIVEAAQPMSYKFRFHVVKSPTLNAFAVPGGHIYLYSGLLLKARHEGEIAGVIAHELSHVKHRHTAQMIGKGTLVSLTSLAAAILGAAATGGEGGQAVMAGALGAGQAAMLAFTREFEEEADRYGLFYMHQAGYDPRGLLDFFDMMMREQRFSISRIPPYLLTHPLSTDRMGQIESLIQLHRLEVSQPREIADFHRFQALLQAEVGGATQVVPLFKQRVEQAPGDAKSWHQLGLIYLRYGWVQEALGALSKSLELDPRLASAWADMALLQARMGRWEQAQAMFHRALEIRPEHGPFLAMMGEALIQKGSPKEALEFLDRALAADPLLIRAQEMRARAKKDLGDEGGFHEDMAGFHEKMDRTLEALKHFRLAIKAYGEKSPKGEEIQRRIEQLKAS